MRGELGAIGSGILGLAVLSAIVSPFTGASSTSFIPPKELSGMSITKWHRLTDSIIAQFASSISLLQLLTLTSLTSMLTIDGGRTAALAFTWTVWLALVCLSILSLWSSEYFYRKFGRAFRLGFITALLGAVGLAVFLDPSHGTTLFGVGSLYAETIQNMGDLSITMQVLMACGAFAVSLILLYIAAIFMSLALRLPEKTSQSSTGRAYNGFLAVKGDSLFALMARSIVRLDEVRKPIVSAVFIGVVLTTFAPTSTAVTSTFAVVLPLVIGLAWGSNAFAHLGGGATWLASQPQALKNAPWVIFGIQTSLAFVLFIVIWAPSIVLQRANLAEFIGNALAVITSSFVVSRSAVTKSVRHPAASHFGARGESSLAPIKALNYTLRFALWGGLSGVILLAIESNLVRLALCLVFVIWQIIRMSRIQEYWNDAENRRKVIMAVAND